MSEKIKDKTIFSLLEVTRSIQKTIRERYLSSYWVKAEMNKLNQYSYSGHCYPELVEKKDGKVIAQVRSILWKDDYDNINRNFLKVLKEPLKDGINILICARILFDPVYGLTLRIIEIDPAYSLGELEREKQETIERIKKEGIFDTNKLRTVPLLPKRIAIISVQTSKGYSDFLKVIEGNSWGYRFFHMLFPALLQGDNAVDSIIQQLNRIRKVIDHFDVVAIMRGGGGDVGLSCYNNYLLSREVALFPIPVITGIGHSTNETVIEMIACKNAITPTDLANYLIQIFHDYSGPVNKARELIKDKANGVLKEEKLKFVNSAKYFRSVTANLLMKSNNQIQTNVGMLFQSSGFIFQREKEATSSILTGVKKATGYFYSNKVTQVKQFALNFRKDVLSSIDRSRVLVLQFYRNQIKTGSMAVTRSNMKAVLELEPLLSEKVHFLLSRENKELINIERSISSMNPDNVLKRGYSITLLNGKVIKSKNDIKEGEVIKTIVIDGNILSTVKTINKSEDV